MDIATTLIPELFPVDSKYDALPYAISIDGKRLAYVLNNIVCFAGNQQAEQTTSIPLSSKHVAIEICWLNQNFLLITAQKSSHNNIIYIVTIANKKIHTVSPICAIHSIVVKVTQNHVILCDYEKILGRPNCFTATISLITPPNEKDRIARTELKKIIVPNIGGNKFWMSDDLHTLHMKNYYADESINIVKMSNTCEHIFSLRGDIEKTDYTKIIGYNSDHSLIFFLTNAYDNHVCLYVTNTNIPNHTMQKVWELKDLDITNVIFSAYPKQHGKIIAVISHADKNKLHGPKDNLLPCNIEWITKETENDLITKVSKYLELYNNFIHLGMDIHCHKRAAITAEFSSFILNNVTCKELLLFAWQEQSWRNIFTHSYGKPLHIQQNITDTIIIPTSQENPKLICYITVPTQKSRPFPCIVYIHGGPFAQLKYEYHHTTQLFASVGFAVLATNFRGSTGFGKMFAVSGKGQWLTGIPSDIIKSINTCVEQGIIDKNNITLYGTSFGATMALQLAGLYPKMFKAVIAISGVYNFIQYLDIKNTNVDRDFWLNTIIGDQYEGLSLMRINYLLNINSPIARLAFIKAPVLLMFAENDEKIADTEALNLAAKAKEFTAQFYTFSISGAGHKESSRTPETNQEMAKLQIAFLLEPCFQSCVKALKLFKIKQILNLPTARFYGRNFSPEDDTNPYDDDSTPQASPTADSSDSITDGYISSPPLSPSLSPTTLKT